MNVAIQNELRDVILRWHRHEPIPTLSIGHAAKLRQSAMHDCLFQLLDAVLQTGTSEEFQAFHDFAEDFARKFKLTADEQGAVVSLAWVALRRGWKRALVGFGEMQATSLTREAEA